MSVRRATIGDEPIVRSLGLQALADTPEAFDSTLEREIGWTTSDWRRWLSHGATFILEPSDGPKVIAAGVPHESDRAAVFLMSIWVHSGMRGTGAADALVASVLSWAEGVGAADAWLHVGKHNGRALRFYGRNGFRCTGREVVRERDGLVEVEMHRALPHGAVRPPHSLSGGRDGIGPRRRRRCGSAG